MRIKTLFRSLMIGGLALAGCMSYTRSSPTAAPQATTVTTPIPTEQTMVKSSQITDLLFSKAFYQPGEAARLIVQLKSDVAQPSPARLVAEVSSIAKDVNRIEQTVTIEGGEQTFELSWDSPAASPRGYGVDLSLETLSGVTLARETTAYDVLERWPQAPRYGFLSDFFPDRADIPATLASINRYHLNALQFYDWMYRHDEFLTDQEPYVDLFGRKLSRLTVNRMIAAAHEYGIAAMPYTAVYASSMDFFRKHPDWAIFGVDGKPLVFIENLMVYMDPRPDSPWTRHLLDQFDQILEKTAFDGIHLDQYGDPKIGYDAQGNPYELNTVLAELINTTQQHVASHRKDGAVVFNAVNNWPIEDVAPSAEDIVYIEVWPPHTWFTELHGLIAQGQKLGKGKAVVLAAYVSPTLEHNVRLMDAIIFGSGGGHIELGEQDGLLADPYFPKYEKMSPALAETVRRYYDFAIRYEDVIGPATQEATRDYLSRISIPGVSMNPGAGKDFVLPIVRESKGMTAINLVNLFGLTSPEWKAPLAAAPTPLGETTLRLNGLDRRIKAVWMATPDGSNPAPLPLTFDQSAGQATIQFPGLAYWDLILIEWEN
ncbi:MAG TPA: glycoside hydrolase family 66 protein [Anaerolineales bacterium]